MGWGALGERGSWLCVSSIKTGQGEEKDYRDKLLLRDSGHVAGVRQMEGNIPVGIL